jgi:hypothetical protein
MDGPWISVKSVKKRKVSGLLGTEPRAPGIPSRGFLTATMKGTRITTEDTLT